MPLKSDGFRLVWVCRPRTAAAGGRPQAGLEFVEKLLTKLTSTDTTERNASMLRHVPHRRIAGRAGYWSWLRVALVVVVRPTEARPQLLGHDLDDGSGAAILGRPGPLLEPAHDHRPVTRLCHLCGRESR